MPKKRVKTSNRPTVLTLHFNKCLREAVAPSKKSVINLGLENALDLTPHSYLFILFFITNKMSWVECVINPNYEIYSEYPYQLRKKSDNHMVKEYKCNGYFKCCLNRIEYSKHRILAAQWIPNPQNLPVVIHINYDKADNHINNLQWAKHHQ